MADEKPLDIRTSVKQSRKINTEGLNCSWVGVAEWLKHRPLMPKIAGSNPALTQ